MKTDLAKFVGRKEFLISGIIGIILIVILGSFILGRSSVNWNDDVLQKFEMHNGTISFVAFQTDQNICVTWDTEKYGRWEVTLADEDGDLWTRTEVLYIQVPQWEWKECFTIETISPPLTVAVKFENYIDTNRINII